MSKCRGEEKQGGDFFLFPPHPQPWRFLSQLTFVPKVYHMGTALLSHQGLVSAAASLSGAGKSVGVWKTRRGRQQVLRSVKPCLTSLLRSQATTELGCACVCVCIYVSVCESVCVCIRALQNKVSHLLTSVG